MVYTPPTLDVVSRLSHGLSREGFSISKYFIMELTFLLLGYITCVPEIQEFCTFAFIGLVVDFYMQVMIDFLLLSRFIPKIESLQLNPVLVKNWLLFF